MGVVDRSIPALCRRPPTGRGPRTSRPDFRRTPGRRYHHRLASMRTNPETRGGSAVPAPTADTTPVTTTATTTTPATTTATTTTAAATTAAATDDVLAREQ